MSYNHELVKKSVEMFLDGIGHPKQDENIKDTPKRVADMWKILLGGYDLNPNDYITTFKSDSVAPVFVVNTQFYSFCAHHLLPFEGKIHVGYIPNGNIIGISKLVRLPRIFAKRLNVQEDLTKAIVDLLVEKLETPDVIVRIESAHSCMTMRGVRSPEAVTVTTDGRGKFAGGFYRDEFNQAIITKAVRSY